MTMIMKLNEFSKLPRWINTEAGRWAWEVDSQWRFSAHEALSVQERRELLNAAERKWTNREQGKGGYRYRLQIKARCRQELPVCIALHLYRRDTAR
ncbi:hypothetical protein HC891_05615 [Candidatus Gracilibacteria bacterium]|nr:hypothetical protein [Candidatus Gracilibacteria bacterium]